MRNAGRQCAKSDEGSALPGCRFDGARGAVETSDEMRAKREPGVGPIAQHLGWDFQHSTVAGAPPCCEIGSVLVPGAETAGPPARHIHSRDHSVFAANMANEVDGAVDQHPPEVGLLALMKQLETGLNPDLSTALDQISELIICQAVEDAQRAKIIHAHQIVAR